MTVIGHCGGSHPALFQDADMGKLRAQIRRRPLQAAAMLLLSAMAVIVSASPAHAGGWGVMDTFDTPSTWRYQVVGNGYHSYHSQGGSPLVTPGGYVNVSMVSGSGWSSTARDLHLSPVDTRDGVYCTVQVAISGYGSANIEVIDPKTWNYIAVRQATASSTWATASLGPWKAAQADVVFRVSALGAGANPTSINVDDFKAMCTYV